MTIEGHSSRAGYLTKIDTPELELFVDLILEQTADDQAKHFYAS